MLVTYETLDSIPFISKDQQVIQQTRIKSNHKCNLIKTCNRINTHQRNKPVANLDRVKYHQRNKIQTGNIKKNYKRGSWRGH